VTALRTVRFAGSDALPENDLLPNRHFLLSYNYANFHNFRLFREVICDFESEQNYRLEHNKPDCLTV